MPHKVPKWEVLVKSSYGRSWVELRVGSQYFQIGEKQDDKYDGMLKHVNFIRDMLIKALETIDPETSK